MKCPNCGFENEEDVKYCISCGEKLKKSMDKKYIIGIVAVVVIIIAAVVFSQEDQSKPDKELADNNQQIEDLAEEKEEEPFQSIEDLYKSGNYGAIYERYKNKKAIAETEEIFVANALYKLDHIEEAEALYDKIFKDMEVPDSKVMEQGLMNYIEIKRKKEDLEVLNDFVALELEENSPLGKLQKEIDSELAELEIKHEREQLSTGKVALKLNNRDYSPTGGYFFHDGVLYVDSEVFSRDFGLDVYFTSDGQVINLNVHGEDNHFYNYNGEDELIKVYKTEGKNYLGLEKILQDLNYKISINPGKGDIVANVVASRPRQIFIDTEGHKDHLMDLKEPKFKNRHYMYPVSPFCDAIGGHGIFSDMGPDHHVEDVGFYFSCEAGDWIYLEEKKSIDYAQQHVGYLDYKIEPILDRDGEELYLDMETLKAALHLTYEMDLRTNSVFFTYHKDMGYDFPHSEVKFIKYPDADE